MDDLQEIFAISQQREVEFQQLTEDYLQRLKKILWGSSVENRLAPSKAALANITPQQTKKRPKRLSSLSEDDERSTSIGNNKSVRNSKRISNAELLAVASSMETEHDHIPPTPTPSTLVATPTATPTPVPTPAPRNAPKQTEEIKEKTKEVEPTLSEQDLMPPPSLPAASVEQSNSETGTGRPQRAAKLKSERNLKEPKLGTKLRRPSDFDTVKVKLEHEQRQSQLLAHTKNANSCNSTKSSLASVRSEDSVVVVPGKKPSVVELNSEDEQTENKNTTETSVPKEFDDKKNKRNLRVKVKREKSSLSSEQSKGDVPLPKAQIKSENTSDESAMASTILSATSTSTTKTKKGRKKKDPLPKPIKVERFSEIDKRSPIATRSRKESFDRELQKQKDKDEPKQRGGSVYEDAVDNLPNAPILTNAVAESAAANNFVNETVTMSSTCPPNATMVLGGTPNDATFCTNQAKPGQTTFIMESNPNATITLEKRGDATIMGADATFNVPVANEKVHHSMASSKQSMETAKDTTQPENESIITEDESFERPKTVVKLPHPKIATLTKVPTSAKAYKMPTRTNELFNPLVQSPVKKKVEAFENVANAATIELKKSTRLKLAKENALPTSSSTTPVIGKLTHAPVLGRFLTPTQSSNITPSTTTQAKKAPSSASKAMPLHKAMNLKSTNSGSTKTLSRENSAEDFRKGMHQLAEERKKQREQKHLLAAQQREAKERERAERIAKQAKEREEKRLKKQMESEQKKRELEEINRKLLKQEEAECKQKAAAKAKAIVEQERELLMKQHAGQNRMMMPPPSKMQTKYTFDMLHEDDSTDDEDKVTHKRPPPPTWSLKHIRGQAILMQQHCPTSVIDSFFSVQPMTPDLKLIFPDIDPQYLKRNSSVFWSTPPRYSELPKYE